MLEREMTSLPASLENIETSKLNETMPNLPSAPQASSTPCISAGNKNRHQTRVHYENESTETRGGTDLAWDRFVTTGVRPKNRPNGVPKPILQTHNDKLTTVSTEPKSFARPATFDGSVRLA
ncbi:hypothetical protein DPMN_053446 [Dreissena polymorpha]|uniref:Uncharacterized protein n=1 Tax=Dreissena polymorpha TaxID=45954 RepID=A0A9D4CN26_DREPO|nr:hypothetical protein DPMN_053446 [Dreissena polymorpha]